MKREPELLGPKASADFPAPRNLLPVSGRTGRACASVRMAALKGGRWSLPDAGIEPGETAVRAAVRGAWENAGVQEGEPFLLTSPHGREPRLIVPARPVRQEAGPEDREHAWADPAGHSWGDKDPLALALVVLRERGWR